MKKYKCNECENRICTASYLSDDPPPKACTAIEGEWFTRWKEVKADEEIKLPKLTIEVFNRPDCPKWAKYAAVDMSGIAHYFDERPYIVDTFFYNNCAHHWTVDGDFDASDWQNSLIERPEKVKLPDWVKVNNIGWHNETGYFKIIAVDDIEKKVRIQHMNSKIEEHFSSNIVCTEVKQARPRPFNDKEMEALVGKVIENFKYVLWCDGYEKESNRVVTLLKAFTAEDLINEDYTVDREPCYKLEHLNEEGEWVE